MHNIALQLGHTCLTFGLVFIQLAPPETWKGLRVECLASAEFGEDKMAYNKGPWLGLQLGK